MPEEQQKLRYLAFDNADLKKQPVYVYSVTGKRDKAQFEDAMDKYVIDGITPKGFAILPGNSTANTLRQLLETSQAAAERVQGSLDEDIKRGGMFALPKAAVRGVHGFIGGMVDQPKNIGSIVGATGAALLTKNMSPLLQALAMSIGATTAHKLAGEATGEDVSIGESTIEGATTLAGAGGIHALRNVLGVGINQVAQNKVYSKLVKYMKDTFGSAGVDPGKLDAVLSTKKGFRDVVGMGLEAVMGSADDAATALTQGVKNLAPTLLKGKSGTLTEVQKELSKVTSIVMDSIQGGSRKGADEVIVGAVTKISEVLNRDFAKLAPESRAALQGRIEQVVQQYITDTNKFIPAAKTLRLLKEAGGGADNTIDAQKLQGLLRLEGRGPGSIINDLQKIAGRGGYGVDKNVYGSEAARIGLNLTPLAPFSRFIPSNKAALGTVYTGTIPGGNTAAVGTGLGTSIANKTITGGIKSFFGEE